jgi:hypothetical protein
MQLADKFSSMLLRTRRGWRYSYVWLRVVGTIAVLGDSSGPFAMEFTELVAVVIYSGADDSEGEPSVIWWDPRQLHDRLFLPEGSS